jgi:hypothetical protein
MSAAPGQDDAAADGQRTHYLARLFPEMPDVLEFESWWTERNDKRRYMLLMFFPLENQFQVVLDDSKTPLSVKVADRHGETLRAWDLHVGAVVDILGRPTTLMSASLKTIQWLDNCVKRLWKRKRQLEERVNKFRPMPQHALTYGKYKRLDESTAGLGGTIPMRKIAEAVHDLEKELAMYQ